MSIIRTAKIPKMGKIKAKIVRDTLVGPFWDAVWGPAIMPAFGVAAVFVLAAFWDI